jgi:hypothetical protein
MFRLVGFFAAVAWAVVAGPCYAAVPALCTDMADQMRALRTDFSPSKWPGAETEVELPRRDGKTDYGLGGDPSHYLQPIYPSQKKRLLAEVQQRDPDHIEQWTVYLASSSKDFGDILNTNTSTAYELKSAGIGRLEQEEPATLLPRAVTYYRRDASGELHIIDAKVVPAGDRDDGEADYFAYDGELSFVGFKGSPLAILKGTPVNGPDTLAVWLWDGSGFQPQCDIVASYAYWFTPVDDNGFPIRNASDPYTAYLAEHTEAWAGAYRRHNDELDRQKGALYEQLPALGNSNQELQEWGEKTRQIDKGIADQDAAYGKSLIDDFLRLHPTRADEVNALVKAVKASQLGDYRPVLLGDQLYLIAIYEPYNGNGDLPDIMLEMYKLKDGKAAKVGAVEAQRKYGGLIKLAIEPLKKPSDH